MEENTNYGVKISKFTIGDEKTDNIIEKDYNWLLDSGTTYVWLPTDVYEDFSKKMDKHCDKKTHCLGMDFTYTGNCVWYTKEKYQTVEKLLESYPVLFFNLGDNNAVFKLYPREWMVKYEIEGRKDEFKFCPVLEMGKIWMVF